MNHGAFVISLKSLDWYLWIFAIFDGEAHPHSSIPAFLKLWYADHKWSSGSALVVLLD